MQNLHLLNANSFPFIFGAIVSPPRQRILIASEGKAASKGMLGKIKVICQIFPTHAKGHSSSSSPNTPTQVTYEDRATHLGKCGRNWVGISTSHDRPPPGKDPQGVFKSSLRVHLFQEVLSDFTQLGATLLLKPTLHNSCASQPHPSFLSPADLWEAAVG